MEFNTANCLVMGINSGTGSCVPTIGKLAYDILVPKGTRITKANIDDFLAYLTTLLTNGTKASRGTLLGKWQTVTESSADAVRESFDFGVEKTIADGAYIWERRITQGGLCAHLALRGLNGAEDQYEFLSVYKSHEKGIKYYIGGVITKNATTGADELKGASYDDIWSNKRGLATGSTTEMYMLRTVSGNVEQWNEDFGFVPVTFEVDDLPRIQDLKLIVTKVTAHTYDIEAYTACGKKKLSDIDTAGVAEAAGFWRVFSAGLTAGVDISTVTLQTNGAYRIVVDDTDADYVAATKLDFDTAPLSVTSASPYSLKYFEGIKVYDITK